MILFKTVKYKNFLSAGNDFTTIQLNIEKLNLVIGKNGSGKSTFLDAINYAIFNKAFRNINKPQLINSITDKGLLVELEFSIGNREYLIRRGMKPNVFEIHQDGKMLNQVADNRDYQGMLENNILRMNQHSFKQIVVLGSANYIPFMQLPAHARREVVEDLLDIQVFSTMNSILKNRVTVNKSAILEVNHKIELCEQKIELQQKHIRELKKNNEEYIQAKKEQIILYNKETEELFAEIAKINDKLDEIHTNKVDKSIEQKHSTALTLKDKINTRIQSANKKIKFYTTNSTCSVCAQDISSEFRANSIAEANKVIELNDDLSKKLEEKLTKIETKLAQQEKIMTAIAALNASVTDINVKINTNNKFVTNIQNELEQLKKQKTELSNKVPVEDKVILKETRERKEKLLQEREVLSVAAALLKDGGIKTLLIKQYVPILNKFINKYLHMMEFFVDFRIDEFFKETIHSRGRDEFTYDSFSQGEKSRINIAILFAFRAVAKMRNSTSTNLLIFDEIFDSALDNQGIDDFIKILHTLTSDTNTFIISHNIDLNSDKFDRTLRFEKRNNFSRIF